MACRRGSVPGSWVGERRTTRESSVHARHDTQRCWSWMRSVGEMGWKGRRRNTDEAACRHGIRQPHRSSAAVSTRGQCNGGQQVPARPLVS
eukprot:361182-Chlamydomonas_euryale.AAC.3